MIQFPKDFIWGTATSAHQTEGNNSNCDWWVWEHTSSHPKEPSLLACDSYNRYEEDFDLCRQLNNNAVRISVEWARIEPEEGRFDEREIDHYRNVLRVAKDRGLKTFVTLHHFTNPIWLSKKGGWMNIRTPRMFSRYAEKCAREFGNLIDVYLTINEPQVYSIQSYLRGRWPPQKANPFSVVWVQVNMMRAHNLAYTSIKKTGNYKVGIVKNVVWHRVSKDSKSPIDALASKILLFLCTDFFLIPISKKLDCIGLNYYFTNELKNLRLANPNDRTSDMGWWLNPEGIKPILTHLKKYRLPIYITENGLADAHDSQRTWFIKETLKYCMEAMECGVDLLGYFHWSLIDNYEWDRGFEPRFGLVEIDRENNLQRKPRGSFHSYAHICKDGKIDK